MRLSVCIVMAGILLFASCGPLPRPRNFQGSLPPLSLSSDASGVVLTATDDSYSSSDVYFYNFATGQLLPLATGESGDLMVKWERQRLWLFNRAAGRESYSSLSPKMGPSSRLPERRTPGGAAGDPSDIVSISESETLLAMGAAHKLAVVNLATGQTLSSTFSMIDTESPTVPFRPGVLHAIEDSVLVFHQALNNQWQALNGGRVFFARKNAQGVWGWADQNIPADGIQGVPLNVSNPVSVFDCHDGTCLVAGACYASMGLACIAGVDELNWQTRAVRHLYDWPTGAESAGPVVSGFKPGQVIACLKLSGETHAKLILLSEITGAISATWDAGDSYCGPFKIDRAGGRVFALKKSGSKSAFVVLNNALEPVSSMSLDFVASAMEVVNE